MDFRFTEEQQMIRDVARDFAQAEIVPIAAEFDASGEFPMETIRKMGELGLMGQAVGTECGVPPGAASTTGRRVTRQGTMTRDGGGLQSLRCYAFIARIKAYAPST